MVLTTLGMLIMVKFGKVKRLGLTEPFLIQSRILVSLVETQVNQINNNQQNDSDTVI